MRETHFIQQNQNKWATFERNLESGRANPDELSELFVEITDDLSYSRTFYPNRSVRVYLNNIAQKVFYNVYRNPKGRLSKFLHFWRDTVPQIIYESRRSFYLSLLVFLVAVLIGVVSTHMDPEFPRVVVGDEYIEMTLNNIADGTPMAVYQDPDQQGMFFRIGINNLLVATWCFALGLLFGVGTLFVLIQNGIMLGSLQYFFVQQGVVMDSFFTIWVHGAIEISCIIIAGAAGLTLGSGLVFPKTLTRLQSLQLSARRGLLIMMTIAPLIVLAAFIEGFITRYTDAPYLVRGIIIFGSFAFVISYYVVYPMLKARRGFTSFLTDVKLPPQQKLDIQYNQIKTTPQLFSDAFIAYRLFVKRLGGWALALAGGSTAVLLYLGDSYRFRVIETVGEIQEAPVRLVEYTWQNLYNLLYTHYEWTILLFFVGFMIGMAVVLPQAHQMAQATFKTKEPPKYGTAYYLNTFVSIVVTLGVMLGLFFLEDGFLALVIIFVVPILLLGMATAINERKNILSGLGRAFQILGGNWLVLFGAYWIIGLMCLIFIFMAAAPIAGFYLGVISNVFPVENILEVRQGFYIFIYTFLLYFLFPLMGVMMHMAYYSFRETKEATSLLNQIPNIGQRKTTYGMEQEMAK